MRCPRAAQTKVAVKPGGEGTGGRWNDRGDRAPKREGTGGRGGRAVIRDGKRGKEDTLRRGSHKSGPR